MSRWNEEFEAHPFQEIWAELKKCVSVSTVDDETILTTVTELARLRKAITYIDGQSH